MEKLIKALWWKILAVICLMYVIIMGFLSDVPNLPILEESIRNLYFHVPMWFSMIIIFSFSVVFSIKYLSKPNTLNDIYAVETANTGIFMGILGITTGMQWALVTWGSWWVNDPKLNGAAISLLIYLAYFVLRNSIEDVEKRARISAVYNIFAFAALIPLLFILPRLTDSLHPGNGGNPGFNKYDLDNNMRIVFYPAVIGWALLGLWLASLRVRTRKLKIEKQ